MSADERIRALDARVERLTSAPHEIGGVFERVFGGLYRLVGWQARFSSARLRALMSALGEQPEADQKLLDGALDEAEDNVDLAERAVAVHGYVPTAHASWLSRALDTLHRVAALVELGPELSHRALGALDRSRVLPPLRVDEARLDASEEAKERLGKPDVSRLLELQLAAIDHVMEAARGETSTLERRRRLLEGARRLLLDVSAALPLDVEGVREREQFLANEITKVDRLQGTGLDPRVGLRYQARSALRRGDKERLYAALVALDSFALAMGDRESSARTGRALDALSGGEGTFTRRLEAADSAEDLARSAEQVFGRSIIDALRTEHAAARARIGRPADPTNVDKELMRLATDYLAPGREAQAMAALLSVDGCFEVGGALAPIRSAELEEVAKIVAHPTPEMLYVTAREVEDVPRAVIEDPRTVLLDLAAGRLLARKHVHRFQRPVTRTRLVGEARVYVLDASTSMLALGLGQSRARMRDAIMVAELATMMRRLEEPGRAVRISLYYRYFTLNLGPLECVRTTGEALAALGDVVGTPRKGGTDIQKALLSSLELIRDAKRDDPDLARASIVLVTDGDAEVDGDLVRAAREQAGDLMVTISVIALGEENRVLRDLVARQRARGERAFYHHIDDQRLLDLCQGRAAKLPLYRAQPAPAEPATLARGLEDVLGELDELEASRRPAAGRGEGQEGALALEEAATRDTRAVAKRFERWFPPPPAPGAATPPPLGEDELADRDAVRIVLSTVAEVVGELTGDTTHRRSDAIDLIERLLPDARLSPARYRAFLERFGGEVRGELAAVHAAVTSAEAGFDHRLAAKAQGAPDTRAGAARSLASRKRS